MDSVLDREELIPVLQTGDEDNLPIDILDRQEILERLMLLLTTLSAARSSCSFALNGKWGSGKTFVLERLERQLQTYQAGEQFMVFHYNCWQYDYYNEPLIAIVSAMLDNIDESTHIFDSDIREKVHCGCDIAKQVVKEMAQSFIENKIGIDVSDLSELVENAQEQASERSAEKRKYDSYYSFHKVINEARNDLSKLAKDQTLVIVVDELDRCLPDYTIKILERLHHLFSGLENTIVILAIDRTQLDNTIVQIFGNKTDTKSYLKKFINFEVLLDVGRVNSSFSEKYRDYIELFDNVPDIRTPVEGFFIALFSGIDARTQERLMERIKTVHNVLFMEDRKDQYFMCLELMLAVFSCFEISVQDMKVDINSNCELLFSPNFYEPLKQYMTRNWQLSRIHCVQYINRYSFQFVHPFGIPELLVFGFHTIYERDKENYKLPDNVDKHFAEKKYIDGLKQVNKLLDVIQ